MKIAEIFDSWVEKGPFNALDLGIYRIIYSFSTLLIVPDTRWLDKYPDSMYYPPSGPFQLISGFPTPTSLVVLELLRSITLVLLGVGMWTKLMSVAVAVMLLLNFGLTYSLGKIDHTILLVLAPLILAFANWGGRLSIDSLRGKPARPAAQWPLRLLALIIGVAFFVAAGAKLATGWLSLSSQAAREHFFVGFSTQARTSWMAEWAATFNVWPAWEILDWLTVLIEFSVLAALPSWRAFRIALALATLFHLGVLLVMNISFTENVIVYGAFVSWGLLARSAVSSRLFKPAVSFFRSRHNAFGLRTAVCLLVLALAVGAAAWFLMTSPVGPMGTALPGGAAGTLIIFSGATIAIVYLAYQLILGAPKLASIKHRGRGNSVLIND